MMRKRSAIIFTGLVSLIIVTYLGYDLLKGIVSPCETIYEQTSVRLGTKLEILQTKGELHVGREKVQDLTEAAQMTALNLKTCCVVLDEGGVDSAGFLQCKNAAQNYEAEIETVVSSIEEADSAKEAGDTAAYKKLVSRMQESLEQALQESKTLEKEVNAIVDSEETKDTDRPSTASAEPTGDAIEQAMGELAFTWDGKTQTYWSIFQADASGEYQKIADTGWLQKGQTQVVELASGDYRVAMYWDRGFEPQDVTVGPGRSLSVHPDFGTIAFTWGGRSQAYWDILRPTRSATTTRSPRPSGSRKVRPRSSSWHRGTTGSPYTGIAALSLRM
jgi:hypothetical protein